MEISKYRMAAKLVAIFDIILTGISLLGSFSLFVGSFGENGKAILPTLLLAVFSLVTFCFAIALWRSTKSNEGYPMAVTFWIVLKCVWFLIGLVAMPNVTKNELGLKGYSVVVISAIVIYGIPLYFVTKYRNELCVT